MSEFRIYVASLADYNAGRLHGVWIDLDGKDAEDIQGEVSAMLKASKEPCAEEWAIHDHEGFGPLLDEYDSFERVAALAEALDEHGEALAVFMASGSTDGADIYQAVSDFEEAYSGEWDSEEDFAQNTLDEGLWGEIPAHLAHYIDVSAIARDLFMGDYWMEDGHVFRNL